MSEYELTIGDTKIDFVQERKQVSAVRLFRSYNDVGLFEFVLFDDRLISKAGLGSIVKLDIGGDVIFSGKVFSEEIFSDSSGRGKYISVMSPFGWCDYIRAKDVAGVPRLHFSQTSSGMIIASLISNQAEEIRLIGAGVGEFYDVAELSGLDEPVENVWFENCSLKSALKSILDSGGYVLTISPVDLHWKIRKVEELDVCDLDLSSASGLQLAGYGIKRDLSERCSAVRFVSDRKVSVGYSPAVAGWDASLEANWQLRCGGFDMPNGIEPDERVWVYRRYSYGGIDGLLEDYPIELVQKVPKETGGYCYQVIETIGIDREEKYIIAKWPVLSVPAGGRINRRNGFVAGKAGAGDVYVRYRYYEQEPEYSQRYPSAGYSGEVLDTAGLVCEEVKYCSDVRCISQRNVVKEWRDKSGIYQRVKLSVRGELRHFTELIKKDVRVRVNSQGCIDLPANACFAVESLEYDFTRSLMTLAIKR